MGPLCLGFHRLYILRFSTDYCFSSSAWFWYHEVYAVLDITTKFPQNTSLYHTIRWIHSPRKNTPAMYHTTWRTVIPPNFNWFVSTNAASIPVHLVKISQNMTLIFYLLQQNGGIGIWWMNYLMGQVCKMMPIVDNCVQTAHHNFQSLHEQLWGNKF